MALVEAYLLALGFAVGLSGALIPGPLLVYTVRESLDHGRFTGVKVILGHALVELAVVSSVALGVGGLFGLPFFFRLVSVLGGLFLAGSAFAGFRETKAEARESWSKHGLVLGGVVFTAFNPSFLPWWATAGSRLLLEGYVALGAFGALIVFLGHLLADFGWYFFVSDATARKKESILARGWYLKLKKTLSVLMLAVAAYFIYSGFL